MWCFNYSTPRKVLQYILRKVANFFKKLLTITRYRVIIYSEVQSGPQKIEKGGKTGGFQKEKAHSRRLAHNPVKRFGGLNRWNGAHHNRQIIRVTAWGECLSPHQYTSSEGTCQAI